MMMLLCQGVYRPPKLRSPIPMPTPESESGMLACFSDSIGDNQRFLLNSPRRRSLFLKEIFKQGISLKRRFWCCAASVRVFTGPQNCGHLCACRRQKLNMGACCFISYRCCSSQRFSQNKLQAQTATNKGEDQKGISLKQLF
jgi:hypothetical protein